MLQNVISLSTDFFPIFYYKLNSKMDHLSLNLFFSLKYGRLPTLLVCFNFVAIWIIYLFIANPSPFISILINYFQFLSQFALNFYYDTKQSSQSSNLFVVILYFCIEFYTYILVICALSDPMLWVILFLNILYDFIVFMILYLCLYILYLT